MALLDYDRDAWLHEIVVSRLAAERLPPADRKAALMSLHAKFAPFGEVPYAKPGPADLLGSRWQHR